MKVVLPGGSGQVGTVLARALHAGGHEVVVLSREPRPAPWRSAAWDARTLGPWAAELEGADAVVNLAGRSVNCRYTPANRAAILESRVLSTRVLGEAVARCGRPPRAWLQASTATIYAHRFDAPNDEAGGVLGGSEPGVPDTWRFSTDVARAWEDALAAADTPATRRVALRSAMVMSPDRGGIFDVLLALVRRGLGGRSGSGRQYVSWIHDADFVRAVLWILENGEMEGPVNLASPGPLPNAEFMRVLRAAWGTRVGLPAAEWMLEVGARVMRTETELVLKSRRVVPGRLLEGGFRFLFPEWDGAARDLCARWRRGEAGLRLDGAVPGG
ncbi:MAG TPA: TIGR01777 family oxidoreductase [Longimicrobiaceae bacterium]|nr:TIGR01777 family oxidoreductase [Longimicrobiaceae bacterium]